MTLGSATVAQAAPNPAAENARARMIDHWTPDRRAAAIPRDLVIDPRGLGYLKMPDGSLRPYGHQTAADATLRKGPPGSGDTDGPVISSMDPAAGDTIGDAKTFKATVTDAGSGVKSVNFVIQYPGNGPTQSFAAGPGGGDTWSVPLSGFSDGDWAWWVEAKDAAGKGGNSTQSPSVAFHVDTAGGGGTGGDGSGGSEVITNSPWLNDGFDGGAIQSAAGRIYFEMLSTRRVRGKIVEDWAGYVCSGTVVDDSNTADRSVILTAAHCVYDDVNKAFARHVLFIPNQDGTSVAGTDTDCSNDPLGCWAPAFGVVDVNWTQESFPANIPWDYAFYVVSDTGAHDGASAPSDSLESSAGALAINFGVPAFDLDGSTDRTHALGYSYSDDPNFMYCAEDMTVESGYGDWWLPSCGLSGGASGGPWVQPMNESSGSGPIISVNSWGYTNQPGMAGPVLNGTSAECIFNAARTEDFAFHADAVDGDAGAAVDCP
ncbi:hypothetical protein GCM10011348_38990 [Marinobacterium nitratireducens]|uniref:Uncharacterized protein n=1 Tax=Marinobacterium nitratireducens TaxID=518897 RepID=A0A918DXH4_9GAMM|nr:hypothetical protein [Marinobacterium nitratireducens]GGO86937.1 hypothetical protein GCM10011348_38990 [Marinobacterium nitratireducens]